jgi:hypothetical protein
LFEHAAVANDIDPVEDDLLELRGESNRNLRALLNTRLVCDDLI